MAGPFLRTVDNLNWYRYQRWFTQPPPFEATLSYELRDVSVHRRGSGNGASLHRASSFGYAIDDGATALAAQLAYRKFVSGIGDNAAIGASLAEWNQSQSMIVTRASQLYKGLKLFRQGRFELALRTMEVRNYRDKMKSRGISFTTDRQKRWSERWLEFHFGWSPLIGDIYNAINVLQSNVPPNRIRASGVEQRTLVQRSPPYLVTNHNGLKIQARCLYFADVEVSNANLHLANQLGLLNPFQVAWEVVPFSFIVDWFVPVSSFLGQWSDFQGLRLTNSGRTDILVNNGKRFSQGASSTMFADYTSVWMRRSAGITYPGLAIPSFTRFSVTRGATAIALLMKGLTAR